uniref:Baculovirus repeated ORF g n=1 Tax=Lymantria dispar multicapsid nuclear polyhedrosis virus TaxID=10449 RepID=A0A1B1MQU8_NPVLD|nr:baculovirus repeated ORF g [Lymantria dispar multiple nucleopolyhedrovirus]
MLHFLLVRRRASRRKRRSRPSLPPLIARPLLESIGRVSCVHNIIDNFAVNNF